jgi:ArsR family metal-binding transcriptional regulator
MRVNRIEKVLPCISDPWKLRIILYLDQQPDLALLHKYLGGRYSEPLGVVIIRSGCRELNFFTTGKVTVREVIDVEEAERLVNHLLAQVEHRQFIQEEAGYV